MRTFFNHVTVLSLRYKWITIAITLAVMVLGYDSFTKLNQELVPDIDFPQTFILVQNDGATSDQMLAMYGIPIEQRTAGISGVVNVEIIASNGFGFATVRNEFGLNLEDVVADILTELETIPLPVRRLVPPDGSSAEDLIGELSPEAVLWLYNWARVEKSTFTPQLSKEVWFAFSPEVLGALPPEVFADLETSLRDELLEKAAAPTSGSEPVFDPYIVAAPELPQSWQTDPRFATAQDISELASVRSLATVFNDLVEDGELIGPLATTHDLMPEDIAILMAIEDACRTQGKSGSDSEEDKCSFVKELNAETVLALTEEQLAALPDDYLDQLDLIDQNAIAQARTAEMLSGTTVEVRNAPLPDAWRVEAPQILTFSFSDFPLGAVSIDSQTLTAGELQAFVDNAFIPRVRDVELVARVTSDGGEIIPVRVSNSARELEGLPALEEAETSTSDEQNGEAPDVETDQGEDGQAQENAPPVAEPSAQTTDYPEGPELGSGWALLAGYLGGGEFNTADDILELVGTETSSFTVESVAGFINLLGAQPQAAALLNSLTLEVLDYWAEYEPGFYQRLDSNTLALWEENAPELYEALPPAATSTRLSENWQRLASMPGMETVPLWTAVDLHNAGAAETISKIVTFTDEHGLEIYAIQLIDSFTPEVVGELATLDENFVAELAGLKPEALSYLSRPVLESDALQAFIESSPDTSLAETLQGIVDGEPTAAERQITENSGERELFVDPDAPAMPAGWLGVAGFVGAPEMDTADDAFNAAQYNGAADLINSFAASPQGQNLVRALRLEHWLYFAEVEEGFWQALSASALRLINLEEVPLEDLPQDVQNRIASGGESYTPDTTITRTNSNPSLVISIYKEDQANTVVAWENVEEALTEFEDDEDITINLVFEQASFITESLEGVEREGTTGGLLAVIMILVFMNLSFRSTLVTSVSIPTSVMIAFVVIRYLPGNVYGLLEPLVDDVGRDTFFGSILVVMLRLFPETFTLNIMTLSGLTVAIGRVVDDSIVVLENIYRNIQIGGQDKRDAVLQGTREMSLAIFAATVTTMLVFIPLGLFGGVVGAFFLPFGLANAYALAGSFLVAITIVPVLADLVITRESMPAEGRHIIKESMSSLEQSWARFANIFIGGVEWLSHTYVGIIKWALRNRWATIAMAFLSLVFGMFLMGNLPAQFLPSFGEPTMTITIALPTEFDGTPITIARTDAKVTRLETWLSEQDGVKSVQATIGGAGQNPFAVSSGVNETAASIRATMDSQDAIDSLLDAARAEAETIFNDIDNDGSLDVDEAAGQSYVTVSGSGFQGGGFGGFVIVVKGVDEENPPSLSELVVYNDAVLEALSNVDGLVNVELESSFGGGDDTTYVRLDGVAALRYIGELETSDTLGTTQLAVESVQAAVDNYHEDNPDTVSVVVSQGFESEMQSEGMADILVSMLIATVISYVLLVLTFGSPLIPIEILVSLPLSIVGAALALTVTGRVLGLSAMIGLLMLIGIVITNALVLLDRVQANRRDGMERDDALIEAGSVRLRPILMTATTTMIAQLPLAASTESGAIIAAELGTVVMGGLLSSTILTLIVLPVVYSLFDGGVQQVRRMLGW